MSGILYRPRSGLTYLEKVAKKMTRCGMFMTAVNEQFRVGVIFKTRCKCWSCEYCAPINADMWCLRATYGANQLIESGETLALVTVTAHERHRVGHAVECLPSQWNKLRNHWQRKVEKPQYILIPEVGKRGHFHIHFITTGLVGKRWWKDNARRSGFGYSNDESDPLLNANRAGFYVGKYLAKQLRENEWKKGFHRVRTSQKWPKLPALSPDLDASFHPAHQGQTVRVIRARLEAQGYSVALADEKASWHVLKTGQLTEGASWLTLNTPNTYE